MKTRRLGNSDLVVSAVGLGCMSMTPFYGVPDEAEAKATLRRAVDVGVTLFDTALYYGDGRNEEIVGSTLKQFRGDVTLATKCGVYVKHEGGSGHRADAEYVRQCCDASLHRLQSDVIDLWYVHRVDPETPVEETIGAMGRCVEAGKVRALGICEVKPETLRRAHATYPITALQSEYSLWTREPEGELLDTCRELGISLVPYSPLGRGFFTGTVKSRDDLRDQDRRESFPRFAEENLASNQTLLATVEEIARANDCTPGQVALAWVLAQGDDIVPIPGTRRVAYVEENAAAAGVTLDAADLATLDRVFPKGAAAGNRVPDGHLPYLNQ
jgi:aryl-alcohol dehydrogenase-like predicted oxidoreductase